MRIIITEFVNEYGNFVFYGAYTGGTPKEAVKQYMREAGLVDDLDEEECKDPFKDIQIDNNEAWVEDVCRAYITETTKL